MSASDNFFLKAEQALKKRNYDYAIELWQQGLSIDPDRIDERKKLRATAIRRCQEKGTNTMGGKMFGLRNAGLLTKIKKLGAQKKWEEQIVETEKYLAMAPQDAKVLYVHGIAFQSTERIDSALQAYREIVDVEPHNKEAWKAMGRLYEQQKEIDKAVECWERVKAADPSDQEAGKAIRDLSASKLMAQTEARRAGAGDDSFRTLLKDADESAKLERKQARIRTADDATSAIEIKRDEVEADAENPRQWRELGDLYLKARNYDEAIRCFKRCTEINPQDMYAKDRIAKVAETRLSNRVAEAKLALATAPDDADLKAKLDGLKAEQNEFLLKELERQVVAHPTDYSLKFKLGRQLLANERYDEAIAQFQAARRDPKFVIGSQHHIGQCFFQKRLYGPAIQQYNEALGGVADHDSDVWKSINYDLAMAHVAKGDSEIAVELLEGIMVRDINFRDVSKKVDEIRGA